jgi:hypothetical protein
VSGSWDGRRDAGRRAGWDRSGRDDDSRGGEGAGGGEHFWEVVFDFAEAAAGEKADPDVSGVEAILGGELLAGDGGLGQIGEGMADEFGIDAAGAVIRLLEGKDDQHAADVFRTSLMRCCFQAQSCGLTK